MKNTLLSLIFFGALAAPVFAQTYPGEINQRRENQQNRIAIGIRTGSLNPGETARLENREHNLNREIRNDRFRDNGHLTGAERNQVNRQQNHLSRSIYRDKHN